MSIVARLCRSAFVWWRSQPTRFASFKPASMMISVARRLIPLAAGAWMALVAGGLVAPRAALAGCGHYAVTVSRLEAQKLSVYELEIFSQARLRGDAGPNGLPSDRPSPCSGLSCSRNPVPPVAPPVPVGPLRGDSWACLALSPACPVPSCLRSLAGHSVGRPVHFAFPPERPPRSL